MGSQLGVRKRNIAPAQGVIERSITLTVPEKVGTTAVNHDYFVQFDPDVATVFVGGFVSANTVGGFSAFTIDVQSGGVSLLSAAVSMLSKAQQIVPLVAGSSTSVAAGATVWVSIRLTGAETFSDCVIHLRYRPLLGSETRL